MLLASTCAHYDHCTEESHINFADLGKREWTDRFSFQAYSDLPQSRTPIMGFLPNEKTEDVCVSMRGVYSGVDIDLQEQEGGGKSVLRHGEAQINCER